MQQANEEARERRDGKKRSRRAFEVLPWAAKDTILEESGTGSDGNLGGGASANQLIGSSVSGKSGVRFEEII